MNNTVHGIDLPVCAFSRSKKYKEYHTNKDNFKSSDPKEFNAIFKLMKKIIDQIESSIFLDIKYL